MNLKGVSEDYKRLYAVGNSARARCNNPKNKGYKDYGGRGIEFKFNSLRDFCEWGLSTGYAEGLSIERIDVNGNYCPENCTWIPRYHQSKNRRFTPKFHGRSGLDEIAEYIGITNKRLQAFIYKQKLTFEEVYDLSKNDPNFFLGHYEQNKIKAMKRTHEWKLSKEDVENIIKELENGKTKSYLARKVYNVDFTTIVKALNRYEEGYYN